MPRRVYTYLSDLGWDNLNLLVTLGSYVLTLGFLLFLINVFWSLKWGPKAPDNPWGADTLEWFTPSPPPPYNFVHIPRVQSRNPLWEKEPPPPAVVGLRNDRREILTTTVVDANVHAALIVPGPTLWPFTMALVSAVGFVGIIFSPWWFVVGFIAAFLALTGWFWPTRPWDEGRDQ